ncbi:hypothetical protein LA080_016294 [Diaporthe eres]|nr:hypothetical protein LA080_016294 [Diaporthe eres]
MLPVDLSWRNDCPTDGMLVAILKSRSPEGVPQTPARIARSFLHTFYLLVGFVPDNSIRALSSLEAVSAITKEDHKAPKTPPPLAPVPITAPEVFPSQITLSPLIHHVTPVTINFSMPSDLSIKHISPPLHPADLASLVLAGRPCLCPDIDGFGIPQLLHYDSITDSASGQLHRQGARHTVGTLGGIECRPWRTEARLVQPGLTLQRANQALYQRDCWTFRDLLAMLASPGLHQESKGVKKGRSDILKSSEPSPKMTNQIWRERCPGDDPSSVRVASSTPAQDHSSTSTVIGSKEPALQNRASGFGGPSWSVDFQLAYFPQSLEGLEEFVETEVAEVYLDKLRLRVHADANRPVYGRGRVVADSQTFEAAATARREEIYCDKWIHDGACAFTQQRQSVQRDTPQTQESGGSRVSSGCNGLILRAAPYLVMNMTRWSCRSEDRLVVHRIANMGECSVLWRLGQRPQQAPVDSSSQEAHQDSASVGSNGDRGPNLQMTTVLAPAPQGPPAGQNSANESGRTIWVRMSAIDLWIDEQFIKSLYQNQTGDNVNVKITVGG